MQYRIREADELKPSGVAWLGDIPNMWNIGKVKHIGKIKSGSAFNNKILENNAKYEVYGGNGYIGYYNNYNVNKKNIIIGRVGAYCGNVRYINTKKFITDNALILKLNKEYNYSFITSLLVNANLNHLNTSNAQPLITGTKILSLKIPILNLLNQQKIANFLDEKSKIFDSVLSKKELLIKKLQDAKQSLISEVVSGKLKVIEKDGKLQTIKREEKELKQSGVEWLGSIPKEWEVSRLKYMARVNMGQSPSSSTYNNKNDGVEFLQGNADFKELYPIARTFTTEPKKTSKINDILFTVRAPVGAMNLSDKEYAIGRGLCSISSIKSSSNFFLWYLMSIVKIELDSISTGSTYEAVSVTQVNDSIVILPFSEEQKQIATYLDEKINLLDITIEKTSKSIVKLKLAKESLISEAVTGKIEIL